MSTATFDAETLLVHGPFLRRLAASLLHDAAAADDVVQQAWLAALRRPPRQGASLRAWLATVTRNLAHERGRREGRLREWEAGAARPEALPSTEAIVQREEARRQVVQAVLGLDEPYRTAILLRFYDDLPPRVIARRLGLPVETVRTRLKRGLLRLEQALDERHGGERRAWALALLPLALPTRAVALGIGAVLGQLAVPLGPAAPLVAATVLVAGLAAGVLLLTSDEAVAPVSDDGGLTASERNTGASAPAPALASTLAPAVEPSATAAGATDDAEGAAHGASPEPLPVEAPPFLQGRVLAAAGGAPRPGAELHLVGVALQDIGLLATASTEELTERWVQRRLNADADGRYRVGGLSRGVWVVVAAADGARPFSAPGVVLVDVPALAAIPAVEVLRRRCEEAELEPPEVFTLAGDSALQLDVVVPSVPLHAVLVRGADGTPLPAAQLTVLSPTARLAMEAAPYPSWLWPRLLPALLRTATGADGRASDLALQPGGLLLVSAAGHQTRRVELSRDGELLQGDELVRDSELLHAGEPPGGVPLPQAGEPPRDVALSGPLIVDLEPAHAITVTGRVVDADGQPIAGADVCLTRFGAARNHEALLERVRREGLPHTASDASGRLRFEAVERLSSNAWDPEPLGPGQTLWALAGMAGTLPAAVPVELSAGQREHALEIVLAEGGPLEVTVLDRATLLPATGASVGFSRELRAATCPVDADGVVSFGTQPFAALALTIRRLGFETQVVEHDWRGGPVELLLEFVPVGWRLSVGLADGRGRPVPAWIPSPVDADSRAQVVVVAWPRDPAPLLAASRGEWRAALDHTLTGRWEDDRSEFALERDWPADEAFVVASCEYEILAVGRAERGQARLDLTAAGSWLERTAVPVTLGFDADEGGSGALGSWARLLDPGTGLPVANLRWRLFGGDLLGLAPHAGVYDLVLTCRAGFGDRYFRLDVPAGGLVATLPLAGTGELALHVRDAGGAPARADLRLVDAGGRTVWTGRADEAGSELARTSTVGPHRLLARGAASAADLPVELRVEDEQSLDVVLRPAGALVLTAPGLEAAPPAVTMLRVADGQGAAWLDGILDAATTGALAHEGLTLWLPTGSYTLTLVGTARESIERRVDLGAAERVEVALR